MRLVDVVFAAAVVAGFSGTALAQTPASSQPVPVVHTTQISTNASQWIATGFVGSNFGNGDNQNTSIDFGGQAAYLWHGYVGAEVLADFSPTFELDNVVLEDNPHVYTYMANGITSVPLGSDGQFKPYISGGIGVVQMRTTLFALDVSTSSPLAVGTVNADETRFGGDIGGGFMGFSGKIGFRGDLRYFKTSVDDTPTISTPSGEFTQTLLSGLAFWRANVGVAFRW